MITSAELKDVERRIAEYLNGKQHTKTRIRAGRVAIMALARFGAAVAVEETRLLLGDVGEDPQMPLPFESDEDKEESNA